MIAGGTAQRYSVSNRAGEDVKTEPKETEAIERRKYAYKFAFHHAFSALHTVMPLKEWDVFTMFVCFFPEKHTCFQLMQTVISFFLQIIIRFY